MINLSNTITEKIKKVLDFLSVRNNLIVGNIANVDTPGYRSADVQFDDQLSAMLRTGDDDIPLSSTSSKHFSIESSSQNSVDPEIVFQPTKEMRMDGNNVDVDSEMVKLAENQIIYSALVQIITKKMNGLKYVIEEGKRG